MWELGRDLPLSIGCVAQKGFPFLAVLRFEGPVRPHHGYQELNWSGREGLSSLSLWALWSKEMWLGFWSVLFVLF